MNTLKRGLRNLGAVREGPVLTAGLLVSVLWGQPLFAKSGNEFVPPPAGHSVSSLTQKSTLAEYEAAIQQHANNGQALANRAVDAFFQISWSSEARVTAQRAIDACINGYYGRKTDPNVTSNCLANARSAFPAQANSQLVDQVLHSYIAMIEQQSKAWIAQNWCEDQYSSQCGPATQTLKTKIGGMMANAFNRPMPKGGGGGQGAPAAKANPAPVAQETLDGGSPAENPGATGEAGSAAASPASASALGSSGAPLPPRRPAPQKGHEAGTELGRAQKEGGSGTVGGIQGKAGGDRSSDQARGQIHGFENGQPTEGGKAPPPFDSTDRCELEAKKEQARQSANATLRGPCPPVSGVPGAVSNLGAAFSELGFKVKAEDQAAKLKLAISRLRLQQYAEGYLKTLSRKIGMSSQEYKRKMDDLVSSCSGPSADVLKNDLKRLVGPLEKEIDSVKFENGRQAYSEGAMNAATELAQYDAKIKTLMGDFPQAPEEMVAHYPPFMPCRSILTVFDQFNSAFSTLGSRAECGPWRGGAFGGKLETCNVELEELSPEARAKGRESVYTDYTPADQLLVEMKMVKPQTGSGASGRECFASRCEKKKAILEAFAVKRAEVLSRFPELAYNSQADGTLINTKVLGAATGTACGAKADLDYWDRKLPVSPSTLAYGASARLSAANAAAMKASPGYRQKYEGLKQACAQDKPVYRHLNDQPTGKAAVDIFDRHLQSNMISKELDANLGRVKAICQDPFAEAEENFKDDAHLNGILNCSVEPAADASPAWKEVASQQAARCAEIKRDPKLACETRESVRNAPTEKAKEVGMVTFEAGMTAMDLSSCFNLVGGLSRGLLRAAAGESASVLAKESASAVVNGIKGLNPANALKTIATSRNLVEVAKAGQHLLMAQGLVAHGIYSAMSADRIAEKALADCTTGILTGEECSAAQKAAQDAWNGAVRDFALGLLVPALEAPGHEGGHGSGHATGHASGHGPAAGLPHETPLGKLYRESEAHPHDLAKRKQLDQALTRELHDPRSRQLLRTRIGELQKNGEITSAQAERLRTTIEKGNDRLPARVEIVHLPETPEGLARRRQLGLQEVFPEGKRPDGTVATPEELQLVSNAIIKAHDVGHGEVGLDGGPARVGNYTTEQLKRKVRILLDEGGIQDAATRKRLVEKGIVGEDEPKPREAMLPPALEGAVMEKIPGLQRLPDVTDKVPNREVAAPRVQKSTTADNFRETVPPKARALDPWKASPEQLMDVLKKANYRPNFVELPPSDLRLLVERERGLVEKFGHQPAVLEYMRDQNFLEILGAKCK